MRFVYSRPFMTAAMPGMFEAQTLDENYAGLARHLELSREELGALDTAKRVVAAAGRTWLPSHYQWLDQSWRG